MYRYSTWTAKGKTDISVCVNIKLLDDFRVHRKLEILELLYMYRSYSYQCSYWVCSHAHQTQTAYPCESQTKAALGFDRSVYR